ncbi:CRISPR-associated endonuclease Cas2 [Magnetospirillum aberrantis]|uniref:CRISPR-associated endoribonuclease Cas2 n=1 Tax=Magnetospirillum aberrantis SpK TaxID=908842 RepID=A0A7C9UYF1_9PROT|nr:CRISPR-associated endonuclease Cas2 [Magnetospirillum aberrantis]NFV79534.1 CRISPR-associated endonuclease Cas2 [Magnetospirillum aberrantis SpK]
MLVVISYDVQTTDNAGRKRLRRIAKTCQDYGQRVQFSVFECELPPARWVELRARLLSIIDGKSDSLRFYNLGADGRRRVEHHGAKQPLDLDGPLIF